MLEFQKDSKENSICQFIIYMTKKRQVSEPVHQRLENGTVPSGVWRLQCYIKITERLDVQDSIVFVFSNKKKIICFILFTSWQGFLALLPGTTHTAMPHQWRTDEIKKNVQTSRTKVSVCSSASYYTKLVFFPIYLDNLSAIKEI